MSEKKLTNEQVKHIARLAMIELTDEEISKFQKQLSDILDYIDKLNEVDTEGIPPTNQVTGLTNVYRDDTPQEGQPLTQDQSLANAPANKNGYFKVKKVL